MLIFIIAIHVIVCIALIMIVLLQTGKGADMGAAFGGGGSQTLFGATGASTFLSKATAAAAIIFMLTSLFLSYTAGRRTSNSILTHTPPAAPSATESTPAPGTESAPAHDAVAPGPAATEPPAAQNPSPDTQTKPAEQSGAQTKSNP